jgi:glycosyltransferase involved in cell wall biosynthesis
MAGNAVAQGWVERLKIGDAVRLLPAMPHSQMAKSYQASLVTLSLSQHDGTPNTLLEAMACGCFPVVGDIESVHEWIIDGENGLFCDPTNPESVARAISRALTDAELRDRARELNLRLISERADYGVSMAAAADFYAKLVSNRP